MLGLLSLTGSPATIKLVTTRLQASGLLAATQTLYYSRTAVPHPNSTRLPEDKDLYLRAKQAPSNTLVWALNTTHYNTSTPAGQDWLEYQLFFLIDKWRQALSRLNEGYESYGVNLHSAPELHFEGHCFWLTSAAMNAPTLTRPFCAFQSFCNHHRQRFPATEYKDANFEQSAPFSSRRLVERLARYAPEAPTFATLCALLVYAKDYFDASPSRNAERPRILTDLTDPALLATLACSIGRLDVIMPRAKATSLLAKASEYNLLSSCNVSCEAELDPVDLLFTTAAAVEHWLPLLATNGIIIVSGRHTGKKASLVTQVSGDYTLLARNEAAFRIA